ncbi:MAG: HAMP domain-containing protein [Candidatus Omnitrophica bacterium]|nr:HAMP domain-containing protein [Candidatus Omnitrophota bacterium]
MRISRKIGLSFFITFLLVILLGALSIYSLRHVYKGLDQVFSKELPASRITYQIAISTEDSLSELNNFLITKNENFKINYEHSYSQMQDNIASLKNFVALDEEKALFEKIKELAGDMNTIAGAIFSDTLKTKDLIKDIVKLEMKYRSNLYKLFDFEENKMLSEKDLLLVNAQRIPASELIIKAKSEISDIMDSLMRYALSDKEEEPANFTDKLSGLDKYIKDYKNYHGYALSEKERLAASELLTLSESIKVQAESIVDLRKDTKSQLEDLFAKEKEIMDTLDKTINLRKSRISSKLGMGNALTEDIPAVHSISKIEKDVTQSWRLSGKYILTGDDEYKNSYYALRQVIEREFKDYEAHARFRSRDKFLETIVQADKGIAGNIIADMDVFNIREKGYNDIVLMKLDLQKKISGLSARNDRMIKEAKEPGEAFSKLVSARWVLARIDSEVSDAERLVMNYLGDQEKAYKDLYSELYFSMKKHINAYRNSAGSDKDIGAINEIESGLDKFNSLILNVMDSHDKIIKERGWDLIKLESELKSNLQNEVENELKQIEKNKKDIRNRIATINTLIFLIMAAVAFIAGFVIFYTTKSITNPIQELHNGAELIGHGNLDYRLNIKTGDEIEELAEGFNKMAGELKGLYTNLENKVKERTQQLAEANEALGRTNKELDDFTYIVSHDLKEPLRGVKAFSKLLIEDYSGKLDDEGKEYLKTISDSSARMTRLIEDLLNLSRIGRIKNVEPDINLNEVLSDVQKNLVYALEERKVELTIKPDFPKVMCDRIRISEVFSNLVSNAIKYTKKDIRPVIEIGWSDKKDFYEFYVKDNGIGIEKQYYDKVFQIFQRLYAKGEYEGTGAGLTIVKKIVENHSGKIWVESEIDAGSTFYFTLPKA